MLFAFICAADVITLALGPGQRLVLAHWPAVLMVAYQAIVTATATTDFK